MVIIFTHFVDIESSMVDAMFQDHQTSGSEISEKEDF